MTGVAPVRFSIECLVDRVTISLDVPLVARARDARYTPIWPKVRQVPPGRQRSGLGSCRLNGRTCSAVPLIRALLDVAKTLSQHILPLAAQKAEPLDAIRQGVYGRRGCRWNSICI